MRYLVLSAVLWLPVVSGCTSPSLREGRWKLSIDVQDLSKREQIYGIPDREVTLKIAGAAGGKTVEQGIDFGQDRPREIRIVEEIEIAPRDPGLSVIYGDIDETGVVTIEAREPAWIFRLQGKVIDETTNRRISRGRVQPIGSNDRAVRPLADGLAGRQLTGPVLYRGRQHLTVFRRSLRWTEDFLRG